MCRGGEWHIIGKRANIWHAALDMKKSYTGWPCVYGKLASIALTSIHVSVSKKSGEAGKWKHPNRHSAGYDIQLL